jgi:hypothetical protein
MIGARNENAEGLEEADEDSGRFSENHLLHCPGQR